MSLGPKSKITDNSIPEGYIIVDGKGVKIEDTNQDWKDELVEPLGTYSSDNWFKRLINWFFSLTTDSTGPR